jgi:hypothetical protein
MRYEIIREFAPCIGVEWQDHFGGTEDYLDPAGAEADRTVFVAGVRAWFWGRGSQFLPSRAICAAPEAAPGLEPGGSMR